MKAGELPKAELDRIFEEDLLPRLHAKYSFAPSHDPTFVVLGGQPGAGKSRVQAEAFADLRAKGPTLVIEGDAYRQYHPGYTGFVKDDVQTMPDKTAQAAGYWTGRLLEVAQAVGCNVVLESTMRQPELIRATCEGFADAGYRVEARVICTKREFSEVGIHLRYEAQKSLMEAARFAPTEAHDAAYLGFPQTVALLQSGGCVDAIHLYTRDRLLAYFDGHGRMLEGPEFYQGKVTARDVIDGERARSLQAEELTRLREQWENVKSCQQARDAPVGEQQRMEEKADSALRRVLLDPQAQSLYLETRPHWEVPSAGALAGMLVEEVEYARSLFLDRGVDRDEVRGIIHAVTSGKALDMDIDRFLSSPAVPVSHITQRVKPAQKVSR